VVGDRRERRPVTLVIASVGQPCRRRLDHRDEVGRLPIADADLSAPDDGRRG
jgi:hypothetical protein